MSKKETAVDVEMGDASVNKQKEEGKQIKKEPIDSLILLDKAVKDKDIKTCNIIAKNYKGIRARINLNDMAKLFAHYIPHVKINLVNSDDQLLPSVINLTQNANEKYHCDKKRATELATSNEAKTFLFILLLMKYTDEKQWGEAIQFSQTIYDSIKDINSRTLDPFNAKAYYFIALVYEKAGKINEFRPLFFGAYRSACLRFDSITQATLINVLLRSFINQKLIAQARDLVSKTEFPESISNNQFSRWLYYNGRINAVQLEYSDSQTKLIQALRKAPEQSAKGFRLQVQKLLIIVELLMGEIPDRQVFSQPEFKTQLRPYLQMVQSVRAGDLDTFSQVIKDYEGVFNNDGNYSLIQRLTHNVIKFGLKKINVSYSRISLEDIKNKLGLESISDTEYIVAKAMRDGVISAKIDHTSSDVKSKETSDIYSQNEPQNVFHKRISFCMDIYKDAVRALEYPQKKHKDEFDIGAKKDDADNQEDLLDSLMEEMDL